jgi:hypothetical protein
MTQRLLTTPAQRDRVLPDGLHKSLPYHAALEYREEQRRSGKSQAIADLQIGVREGLPHPNATANRQCPSSSTVALQFSSSTSAGS